MMTRIGLSLKALATDVLCFLIVWHPSWKPNARKEVSGDCQIPLWYLFAKLPTTNIHKCGIRSYLSCLTFV